MTPEEYKQYIQGQPNKEKAAAEMKADDNKKESKTDKKGDKKQ